MEVYFDSWRDQIHDHLLKNTEPGEYVDMYPLGVLCPRPSGLSKEYKMKQILKDDPKDRFKFLHPHKVRRKVVVDEKLQNDIDALQKLWRNLVWEHMQMVCKPGESVALAAIGIAVRRPHENIAHTKLRPLLESDPKGRFNVTGYGLNIQVRLVHNESAAEVFPPKKNVGSSVSSGLQGWRDRIAEYLATAPFEPYMSQLGAKMPRPADVDPSVKMQDVLQSDPLRRFTISAIDGRFGSEKVGLRKAAAAAVSASSVTEFKWSSDSMEAGSKRTIPNSQLGYDSQKKDTREIQSALTAVNDALAGLRTSAPAAGVGGIGKGMGMPPQQLNTNANAITKPSSGDGFIGSAAASAGSSSVVPGMKYAHVAAKAVQSGTTKDTAAASASAALHPHYLMPTCIICMERERNIVLLPCRHLLTCEDCGETVFECPVCREGVSHRLIVFAS